MSEFRPITNSKFTDPILIEIETVLYYIVQNYRNFVLDPANTHAQIQEYDKELGDFLLRYQELYNITSNLTELELQKIAVEFRNEIILSKSNISQLKSIVDTLILDLTTKVQNNFFKGDKGEPFRFSDFTQEQIELLKVKGDKGDPFTYADFTQSQLSSLLAGNIGTGTQSFNGFGGSGFKNLVINGLKQVNQTGLTSTDNSYNYDNHYKSGNNWYIPIDGRSIISGTKYVLSWAGAATASYHISNATSLTINSQTFTPIAKGESITPIISAGQNLWIKFSSDSAGSTYNFVQFERGSTPSPFELRPYPFELFLCMSLYELLGTCSFHGYGLTGNAFSNQYRFKVTKRINPSVYTGSILTQINCTIGTINANTIFATMPITVTNNGAFVADVTNVVADARF